MRKKAGPGATLPQVPGIPEEAVSEAPKPPLILKATSYKPLRPPFIPNVLKACKYCQHLYIDGGCNFERQKTCGNHPVGKKREIATIDLG